MQVRIDTMLARCLLFGTVGLMVLMPFHALLTVWLASLGADYTLVRLWKEFALIGLAVAAGILWLRSRELQQALLGNRTIRYGMILIGLYALLHLLAGSSALLAGRVSGMAFGYALIGNLRPVLFFLVAVTAGLLYREWLAAHWRALLVGPAVAVVGFGLLQATILPVDVLRHVGYGQETIAPYLAIDNKPEYARLQSTLRGPNPLGAYLVVVLVAALLWLRQRRWLAGLLAAAGLIVLYGTHSRSAWLGLLAAVAVIGWALTTSLRVRRLLVVAGAILVLVVGGGIWLLRDNDTVQNIVFHTDENSTSVASSNSQRAGAIGSALRDIVREPLGRGPGTAGPASVYNHAAPRISENYFLQIGQEIGVFGVTIFLALAALLMSAFWRQRTALPALPLLMAASLAGLVVVNTVSHAWMDDTLAYIWWGLAGWCVGMLAVKTMAPERETKREKS